MARKRGRGNHEAINTDLNVKHFQYSNYDLFYKFENCQKCWSNTFGDWGGGGTDRSTVMQVWGPEFKPPKPCKKLGVLTYMPETRPMELGQTEELTGTSEWPYPKGLGEQCKSRKPLWSPLASALYIQAHVSICTCMCTHTIQYTFTTLIHISTHIKTT